MSERRTAINCPQHGDCVCVLVSVPEGELGERRALKLPQHYTPWLRAHGELIIAVEHSPAPPHPDGLLVGDLIIAPKDIGPRMTRAEALQTLHTQALATHGTELATTKHDVENLETDVDHLEVDQRLALEDSRNTRAALLNELAKRDRTIAGLTAHTARLEAFVTRRKRWRKKWDRG